MIKTVWKHEEGTSTVMRKIDPNRLCMLYISCVFALARHQRRRFPMGENLMDECVKLETTKSTFTLAFLHSVIWQ